MTHNDFLSVLCKDVKITVSKKEIELNIENFFGNSDLKLTIFAVNDLYYVHDNMSAVSALKKNAGEKFNEIFEKVKILFKIEQSPVFGQLKSLMSYLQLLVFIANSDLVYKNILHNDHHYWTDTNAVDMTNTQDVNLQIVTETLNKCCDTMYIENQGLIIKPNMLYPLNSTYGAWLMNNLTENSVQISDNVKNRFHEGSILENFYWGNNDIENYTDFISPILNRFGGELVNKEIILTAKINDGDFAPSVFKFFNLAVLLSQLGLFIKLPTQN